jgi:hypothetical protein
MGDLPATHVHRTIVKRADVHGPKRNVARANRR